MATAVHELYVPALGVERGDRRVQLQVDAVLQVERRRAQRIRLCGRSAREEALRKVGAITRPRRIRAQHGDAAGIALAPERFGGGVAGGTTTQDYHRFRSASRHRKPLLFCARELFANIHAAVPLLDAPAGDRVQRRGAQGPAGTQAKTGMMPRATNRVADQQPVGQRGAIVRANSTDREQFVTAPRKQHRFAVCVPKQHSAVGNFRERDALDEVRSTEFVLCFVHSIFLTTPITESRTGVLMLVLILVGPLARSQIFIAYRTTAVRLIAMWVRAIFLTGGAPPL